MSVAVEPDETCEFIKGKAAQRSLSGALGLVSLTRSCSIVPQSGRLYFASLRFQPKSTKKKYYFSTDDEFIYEK